MNERRRSVAGSSLDGFEVALRDVLVERVPSSVPASLRATVADVTARDPAGASQRMGRLGTVAALAMAGLVLVAFVAFPGLRLGRSAGVGQGDGGPSAPIDWDSGGVQLHADAFRITAGTVAFVGVPGADVGGDPGDPHYRTLEVEWGESGVPMRLNLYLAADDTHWWVTEIRTYDGSRGGEWIAYDVGPFLRTPIGSTFAGDVLVEGRGRGGIHGSLLLQGLRLTAFAPGTGPAPPVGCQPVAVLDPTIKGMDGIDPLAPGQPLAGTGIEKMTAVQAEAFLGVRGLCHEYRYSFGGYSERWCQPPPGRVSMVAYLGDGSLLLFVRDPAVADAAPRPQPPAGWGCPTDQRGNAIDPSASPPPSPIGPGSTTVVAEPGPDAPVRASGPAPTPKG